MAMNDMQRRYRRRLYQVCRHPARALAARASGRCERRGAGSVARALDGERVGGVAR
jgi:hypothetical protein